MNVLVIGFGSAGRRHAHNARELGHEVAVMDADPGTLQEVADAGFGVGIDVSVEAAVIATPAATHPHVARSLLKYGYAGPLFVEKPLDVTTDNADFWRSWPHPTAMVGYNWRFHPGALEFMGMSRGSMVKLKCFTDMATWPGGAYVSPALECSHEIDLLMHWGRDTNLEHWAWGEDELWMEFAGGDQVETYWASQPQYRVFIARDAGSGAIEAVKIDSAGAQLERSYQVELGAFLQAAERGDAVPGAANFRDGLRVVEIVEQAEGAATVEAR